MFVPENRRSGERTWEGEQGVSGLVTQAGWPRSAQAPFLCWPPILRVSCILLCMDELAPLSFFKLKPKVCHKYLQRM